MNKIKFLAAAVLFAFTLSLTSSVAADKTKECATKCETSKKSCCKTAKECEGKEASKCDTKDAKATKTEKTSKVEVKTEKAPVKK